MENFDLCEVCKGKKQLAPLGGVLKDCGACNAVGWIEKKKATTIAVASLKEIAVIKKRGRPRREK